MSIRIALDLRGLNHGSFTGVNHYTLRLLKHLPEHLNKDRINYTGLGLFPQTYQKLLPVLPKLARWEFLSVGEYARLPQSNDQQLNSGLTLLAQRFFPNTTRCQSFDLVVLPQPKALPFHPESKVVTVFHDFFGVAHPEFLTFRHRLVENLRIYRSLIQKSSFILVNSYATGFASRDLGGAEESRIRLLYPADLGQSYRSVFSSPPRKNPYLLAISSLEPRKNWLNLLAAYADFYRRYPEVGLVILGHRPQTTYAKKLLNRCREQAGVTVLTNVSEETKHRYLQHCRALLYPSFYEGFGFPILEAQRYAKPVVTSPLGSMPEIAGQGGVYANPYRPLEIGAALRLLQEDPEYYRSLQDYARTNYTRFSWNDFERRLHRALRDALLTN